MRKDWLEERLEDERRDSETYWRKYVETGDELYRTLSEEELRHAGMLCGKLPSRNSDAKTS